MFHAGKMLQDSLHVLLTENHFCRPNYKQRYKHYGRDSQFTTASRQTPKYPSSARPEGLEPPTVGSEDRCSIQLSYGRFARLIIMRLP